MSFLKSAINQVGRDMGKVVSNQIFGDAHSTPYRRTGNYARGRASASAQTAQTQATADQILQRTTALKNRFDTAIDFQLGKKSPRRLIEWVTGVYIIIKNEVKRYMSDGYLDTTEASNLFIMMKKFNEKVEDVCDVFEVNPKKNKKEIDQLTKIVQLTNELFKQTLKSSLEGCEKKKLQYEETAKYIKIDPPLPINFFYLNAVSLRKYVQTGKKNFLVRGVVNLTCLIFDIIYTISYGIYTALGGNSELKTMKILYQKMTETERKRAETYRNYLEDITDFENLAG